MHISSKVHISFLLTIHTISIQYLSTLWPRIICYVTNDTVWKIKPLRKILDKVGLIAKKKMTTDSAAVRGILTNIKKGRIIGIFPEGMRSWDGCTKEIIPSTSSLIKKLKVPVVTVRLKGAMMSRPRWAMDARRGRIVVEPKIALRAEQIKEMTAEEIQDVISKELSHSETAFLRENERLKYRGKNMAEFLELFLFVCRDCGSMAKMRSERSRFFCTECGSEYIFDRDATLYKEDGKARYTLNAWDEYQKKETKQVMDQAIKEGQDDFVLFEDPDVSLLEYIRLEPLRLITKGTLRMTPRGMDFTGDDGKKRVYLTEDISGANIQKNNQFEFTHEGRTFRFLFNERVSPYKWQLSLKCARTQ